MKDTYKVAIRVNQIFERDKQKQIEGLKTMDFITNYKNLKYYKLQIKSSITRQLDETLNETEVTSDYIKSFYNKYYNQDTKANFINQALFELETLDKKTIDLNSSSFLSLELKDYANDVYNKIINKKYIELKKAFVDTKQDKKTEFTDTQKQQIKSFKHFVILWLVIWLLLLIFT